MEPPESATPDELLAIPMVRRFWDALSRFFGEGFLREVMDAHANPLRASQDLKSPVTFFSALSRLANASADRQPPPKERDFGQLGRCVLEILQAIYAAAMDPAQSSVADVVKDAVNLLAKAKASAGTDKVAEILGGRPDSKMLTMKAAFAILGMLRVCYAPMGGTFEERVSSHATAIKHLAENVYKPLLVRIVDLEELASSFIPRRPYLNLGPLIRDVERTGHGVLVDRNAYLVRNAEAHAALTIDPDHEQVTFVNVGPQPVRLGPWTESQLHACSEHFLACCLALYVALLGFIAEEVAAWMKQEHPEWLG